MGNRAALAYLAVFVGVCGHASSEFFAVLSGTSGPETSVWRYVLGSVGLIIVALAMKDSRDLISPLRQDWRAIVPLSLVGVSLPYLAFHWALDFATIVQVGTLVTTIPIFVALANLIANRAPIGLLKMISGVAAVLGVALLLTDGYLAELAGRQDNLFGIGLCLVCAFLVSTYAVLAKPLIARHGAVRLTTISMTVGGVGLWLLVGFFWGIWVNPLDLFDRPAGEAGALLTLAFWNTTITQILWLGGLAAVPDITRGSYLFFLKPVITALLSLMFLTQPITLVQVLAILVICGAVAAEMAWPAFKQRVAK